MTYETSTSATLTDAEYYQARAETEIEAAQAASHAAVVRAHYELASHYLDLVQKARDPEADAPDRAAPGSMTGQHIIGAGPSA